MPKKQTLTLKQRKWLGHYFRCFNGAEAARRAGYKTKNPHVIGAQNLLRFDKEIAAWIDEHGLSDAKLKQKLLEGLDSLETKFFSDKGKITDEVEVIPWEVRRRYLDMAFKCKGFYAPERHELTGKDGQPISFAALVKQLSGEDEETSSEHTAALEE